MSTRLLIQSRPASLDQVNESRRAAVKAGRRPIGIDVGMAAVVATGVGLAWPAKRSRPLSFSWPAARQSSSSNEDRPVGGPSPDQRALGARMWRFALLHLVLFLSP